MQDIQTYEAAAEEGIFGSPLRNIRIQLDGTAAIVDLIPSVVLDKPTDVLNPEIGAGLNKILAGSRPIVEANRFMRVHFDGILALVIQEEFIEVVSILDKDLKSAPRLSDGRAPYPILRVLNSAWKRCLPDYQGRDNPELNHFKIVSMETCIDILGYIEKTEWLENS